MELEYAFLADRADRLHDDRLVVFGGDIDKATVSSFPALFRTTLVARLRLHPEEALEGHVLGLECTSPEGKRLTLAKDVPITTIRNPDEAAQPSAARILIELTVVVGLPGPHLLHIMLDQQEVKSLRFRVIHVAAQGEA
jgi:hypothetical protein